LITFKQYLDYANLPPEATISDKAAALWGITPAEARRKSRNSAELLFSELREIEQQQPYPDERLCRDYKKMQFGPLIDIEHQQAHGDRATELAVALLHDTDYEEEDIVNKRDELLNARAKHVVPVYLQHVKKKTTSLKPSRRYTKRDLQLAKMDLTVAKALSVANGASTRLLRKCASLLARLMSTCRNELARSLPSSSIGHNWRRLKLRTARSANGRKTLSIEYDD
jgi:hypothetical protein